MRPPKWWLLMNIYRDSHHQEALAPPGGLPSHIPWHITCCPWAIAIFSSMLPQPSVSRQTWGRWHPWICRLWTAKLVPAASSQIPWWECHDTFHLPDMPPCCPPPTPQISHRNQALLPWWSCRRLKPPDSNSSAQHSGRLAVRAVTEDKVRKLGRP